MTIKIESKPLPNDAKGTQFREFVLALRDLKVGEHFTYELGANHRLAIATVQHLLDRKYTTRREHEEQYRVVRLV